MEIDENTLSGIIIVLTITMTINIYFLSRKYIPDSWGGNKKEIHN